MKKTVLLDFSRNFSSEAVCDLCFMSDYASSCPFHTFKNCFCVPGEDSSEVNNFTIDAFFFCLFHCKFNLSKLGSIRDYCYMRSMSKYLSFSNRNCVVFLRYFFFSNSIQRFWFKKYDRIFTSNSAQKHSFCLNWASWYHDNKSWSMSKVTFNTLRMIMCSMPDSPIWRSNCQTSAIKLISTSVSELCSFINDLVKSRKYVICKLHLCNGSCPSTCIPDCKPCNTLLTQRSVENSIRSIFLVQINRASKNASKFNIFAEQNGRRILGHCYIHCVIDRFTQVHLYFLMRVS